VFDKHQLATWFDKKQQEIEATYLESDDPYRQSGWGSTPQRWQLGRELILEAVPHHGTFLDIGCANGLLRECLMQWASERGIYLTPYGIDVSPKLIELARLKLPTFAPNLAVNNGLHWQPSKRFDYVHTLLEYVPDELRLDYLKRLLNHALAEAGRLIVSSYSNRSQKQQPIDVAAYLQQHGFQVAGSTEAIEVDGWVLTRVAWVNSTVVSSSEI
jgi:trans-aconitate methyltransferase